MKVALLTLLEIRVQPISLLVSCLTQVRLQQCSKISLSALLNFLSVFRRQIVVAFPAPVHGASAAYVLES